MDKTKKFKFKVNIVTKEYEQSRRNKKSLLKLSDLQFNLCISFLNKLDKMV